MDCGLPFVLREERLDRRLDRRRLGGEAFPRGLGGDRRGLGDGRAPRAGAQERRRDASRRRPEREGAGIRVEELATPRPVWKSKFYGAFALNLRLDIHAIDATPARWRGDAGSSPLDRASTAAFSPRNDLVKNYRVHPMHWLISTQ